VTLFLSEDDVQELLTPADAVEAVEGSFRRMGAGVVEIAPRRRLELQEGRLADMAASDLELGYACVKAYAASGDGAAFVVALFAVDRPELVALIEADNLGRLRTGAASAVAAKYLVREGATSLGVIFPVLKDSGTTGSRLGEFVIAAASIAEFGSIILLSLFFSGKGSTDIAGKLILLAIFGALVVVIGVVIAGLERFRGISGVLQRLQDTTAQIRVRGAFVLLIGFVALAENVGLEVILGAFAAGALLSLIDRDRQMTHPEFRVKLEAAGFGIFIPVFFVTTGLRFNLDALFASAGTIAHIPLFLLALLLVRGLPALVYGRLLGRQKAIVAGILQATSLPFIVAAAQIGMDIGVVSEANGAALIAAGLLSVIIFPALGLTLLRRGERGPQATERTRAMPTPAMPVMTAEQMR